MASSLDSALLFKSASEPPSPHDSSEQRTPSTVWERYRRPLLALIALAVVQMVLTSAGQSTSTVTRKLFFTAGKHTPAPPAALFAHTPATLSSITDIHLDQPGLIIPKSFLGLSHEWGLVEQIAENRDYVAFLKLLTSYGSGPLIFRIGGSSADRQDFVPNDDVWRSLSSLHNQTGCKYIIGLNFEKGDVALARRQMQAAKASLPARSILTFEIGNEPNYYINKTTTDGPKSGNEYVAKYLVPQYFRFSEHLACLNGWPGDGCAFNGFAGPAWGHISMKPATLAWFLSGTWRWMSMSTVHWYRAQKEDRITPVTLLDEQAQRDAMKALKQLVDTAKRYEKPLHVAESNTLSNGGHNDVCNTMAAALWTLDGAVEVAKTGAQGINYHQSQGRAVYSAIHRNESTDAHAEAPFYGMMLFQQAVQDGAHFVGAITSGPDCIKVHPLRLTKTNKLQALLLNKDPFNGASVTLRLSRSSGYGGAKLTRLVAKGPEPLYANPWDMTIGGKRWGRRGATMTGTMVEEYVRTSGLVGGKLTYTVYMPPGSAAVMSWY